MNLDGLPIDLPDLDSLIDAGAEIQADAVKDAFGVKTFALSYRERATRAQTIDPKPGALGISRRLD